MPKKVKARTPRAEVLNQDIVLPALFQLRPYQKAWVDDPARACFAVKSARIGFSVGTGIKRTIKCLARENRTCTVLSASKAQSIEFVENVQKNVQAMGAMAQYFPEETFTDFEGATSITQSRIQFPNGSRIIALPANPRTARGYPGDAVLDEFAHHQDSYAIWAAIIRQIALGNEIDVLSTPNGEQGKYFDLAKELGMTDGVAPSPNPSQFGIWSRHWIDVHLAVAQGCPIDIQQMRELIRDEDTFAQEFLCVFLKASGAWLPLELIAQAEDDNATTAWPSGYVPSGPLFAGIDVARDRDTTVMWLDERIGDVSWTRMVLRLHGMPLTEQHDLLAPFVQITTRTAIDATGMGVGLYDMLDKSCRGRVMGINFAGVNEQHVRFKTDLAIRIKKKFEIAKSRIPRDNDIRQELMAIKRESTATGVKFDAPRIELESAVAGAQKKKVYGHADSFWAKALADLAADSAPDAVIVSVPLGRDDYRAPRQTAFGDRTIDEETTPIGGLTVERRSRWV